MVTVEISRLEHPNQFHALRGLILETHLYRRGTDPYLYYDLRDRVDADLLVANLNSSCLGISARVLPSS